MPRVTVVKVMDGYRLELVFDDGAAGSVDLSSLAGKGVFAPWLERGAFARVRIGRFGELIWDDQVDLCADALYLRVTGKEAGDLFPGLRNQAAHA